MTLIFTDEPDESFTGAAQPANGIYQPLLKISRRSTNRGTNPVPIPTLPSQTVPDSKSAARYFTIRRMCSLPILGGDVPQERGVCSDVVIRALRSQKVDLQKLVHEDMAKNFADYPQKWKLKRPDSNIDHRRVPNLETWFTRHDKTRPTSKNPSDYQAGDIVSRRLDNGLAHIGVVSDGFARDGTPLVIHNIGAGAQEEDVLFSWRMVGHYRYFVK